MSLPSHINITGTLEYRLFLLICLLIFSLAPITHGARVDNIFTPVTGNITASPPRATLTFDTNGKILAVGSFDYINGKIGSKIARLNLDLTVDPTFSCIICDGSDIGNHVLIQPDGKYLISIRSNSDGALKLFRLFSDGSLDPSFVSPFTDPGQYAEAVGLLTDGTGRIIVMTAAGAGGLTRKIYRIASNGALDNTFTPISTNGTLEQFFTDIQVMPDQKLMISGAHPFGNLFRVNLDGGKDFSFSSPVLALTSLPTTARINQFTVEADGKISFSGLFDQVNGIARKGLARLGADQGLDQTFNPTLPLVPTTFPNAVRRQSDGKYVVGASYVDGRKFIRLTSGGSSDATYDSPADLRESLYWILDSQDRVIFNGDFNNENSRISRLTTSGSKDPTFRINIAFGGEISKLAVGPDGKVIVAGNMVYINNTECSFLVRLNRDGSVDPTFVTAGIEFAEAYKLIVLPDLRVIGLFEAETMMGVPTARLVRFGIDGTIDPSFDFIVQRGQTMELQPDGKLLVGGGTMTFSGFARSGVLRINTNGTLDTPFNPGIGTPSIRAIAVQSDGKIIIGGGLTSVDGISRTNFARLNSNGTLDQSFTGSSAERISNIVQFADGSLVVSASTHVRRYSSSGAVDNTFQAPEFNPVDTVSELTIRSMVALPNGSIVLGGSFDAPANNIVLLRSDGSVDASFLPSGAGARVESVNLMSGNRVLSAGFFKKIGGVTRLGIAAIVINTSAFDFDGDGKTDIGIFRPVGAASEWWINRSGDGQTFALQFGASTDRITPADYTGDGKADIAFFRPSSGEWYVLRSEDFSFFALPFGTNGDAPVPADYDADGKADFAVFRPSSSTWFISRSAGGGTSIVQFGATGDQPVVADYDGDGKADIGIFRPAASGGEWWIQRSTAGLLAMQFGANTDKPVQGDYTGDGKADVAIWRPSTGEWYIVRSEDSSFYGFPFGASGDTPAPGDYDGDGKFDPTVFRPSSATWFIARTTAGTQIVQFGATGDRPIPNAFIP